MNRTARRRVCELVAATLILSVITTACGESKPPKEFELTIVTADAIGESKTSKLPQELVELSLPIPGCKSAVLVPKPFLERLGFDRSSRMSLETRVDPGFAGDKTNPRLIKRRIEDHLSGVEVGPVFASSQKPGVDLNAAFNTRLSMVGRQSIVAILASGGASGAEYRGITIYSDVAELRKRIVRGLCEDGLVSAVVFLNPPLNPPRVPPPPPPPVRPATVASSLPSQIEARNAAIAATSPGSSRVTEATEAVREYRPKVGDDPLALYALSKTVIYEGEHDEAFELLERAARLAIRQNRATELVALINRDMESDRTKDRIDRTVWRLSTHPHHWVPIMRALVGNDETLLHDDADSEPHN